MSPWIFLVLAIGLEVAGTTSMKLSHGFTRLGPSVLLFAFYFASFGGLTMAVKHLDISLVYAVWSGLGTVAITAIGIWYFHEPVNALKLVSIALIVVGVVGLNLSETMH